MEAIARQLDAAGRRARRLLIVRRLAQFVAVAAPACVALGLLDWLLRLPGWFRLIVLVGLLVVAGVWLWGRLGRAMSFGPSVSEMALRAERLFPDLRGWLASGLELSGVAATPAVAGIAKTSDDPLAKATVAEAQRRATGRGFGQLVDPSAARRSMLGALAGLVALMGIIAIAPASAKVAAERWLLPLGDVAWPKRVQVEPVDWPQVLAADTPARLSAEVQRGMTDGLRVWLSYHFEHDPTMIGQAWRSPTRRVLMNPQSSANTNQQAPRFASQVDPPTELIRLLNHSDTAAKLIATIEAGDDASEPIEIPVVLRPGLTAAQATLTPPAYARPYVPTQTLDLPANAERLGTLNAVQGSQLELRLTLNSALDVTPERARTWLVDLSPEAEVQLDERSLIVQQTIDEPTTFALLLEDQFGLTDTATRRLRIVTTPDALPTVGILEPATDLSLLPTAELPVRVQASDDVGLLELRVALSVPQREGDTSAEQPDLADDQLMRVETLALQPGPAEQLNAEFTLALSNYDLRPGDVAVLDAYAQDVFDSSLGDRPPTAAVSRRLTIIDAATLLSEVQRELGAVRRSAERLRIEQAGLRRAQPDTPSDLAGPQQRLSRGVAPAASRLDAVRQRLDQNKLEEAELDELIADADRLLDEAAEASEQAAEQFAQDTEPAEAAAREAQQQAERKLTELTELLDQGGDALSLRLEIGALRAEQEAVALDTRQLLPQTAGRSLDELTEAQRAQVQQLAERQAELAEKSRDLVRRMSTTAEALEQSSERDADQAAAEALAEAAELARRQGLQQQMQNSAEQAEQNRLSQAGQDQLDALDTLDRMLEQMGQQDAKRRERLQRRLRALAERIERLIADQRVLRDRLPQEQEQGEAELNADAIAMIQNLAEPQASLWQRIIVVQTDAERDPATEPIAPILGEAANAAANAVGSLRGGDLEPSRTRKTETIDALERALEQVRQAQQEQREQDAQQQRAQLRDAYLELADRQDALRGEAEPLATKEALNRRDRAELRKFAEPQDAIAADFEALREEVSGQVVFEAMHDRLNARLADATTGLRGGGNIEPAAVPMAQAAVAAGLRAMADALVPPPSENDFAQQQQEQGGGGGAGSGEVIPDAAQLKLLRGEQAGLLERTAAAQTAIDADRADPIAIQDYQTQAKRLATQQRELTRLAERLKLEMERQRRNMMPLPEPQSEGEVQVDLETPEGDTNATP
ncbi:MAG: hypothetical protein AAGF84_09400 [Planctomycetota bacterium]